MVQVWSGREVRALRECQRLSIREFAARIGVSERMVSRWEAGGENIRPRPINQEGLDSLLAAAGDDERARFAVFLQGANDRQSSTAEQADPVPEARLPASGGLRQSTSTTLVPERTHAPDALAIRSFRSADRQMGGGHLYAAVVKYLHSNVGPRLFGGDFDVESTAVFTAAAGLTEMAGWMAHDAGRDDRAHDHFMRAFHLSKAGQDRQLGVHILASLSHLAHHRTQPNEAIRFARAGEEALAKGPVNPELAARILAMQARGYAALGDDRETRRLLAKAEGTLDETHDDDPSDWVSHFDLGSLSSEAARCMRQLGKPAEARAHAQRIIELRPSDRTRSRAFGQLLLISTLIEQGEPEEASLIAREVVDATQSLGSYLVVQQFQEVQQELTPYVGLPVVRETTEILADTVRQRVWLQQWMNSDAPDTEVEAR